MTWIDAVAWGYFALLLVAAIVVAWHIDHQESR